MWSEKYPSVNLEDIKKSKQASWDKIKLEFKFRRLMDKLYTDQKARLLIIFSPNAFD